MLVLVMIMNLHCHSISIIVIFKFCELFNIWVTFWFFGNDRAAPVDTSLLILCTTYTHIHHVRIYNTRFNTNFYQQLICDSIIL